MGPRERCETGEGVRLELAHLTMSGVFTLPKYEVSVVSYSLRAIASCSREPAPGERLLTSLRDVRLSHHRSGPSVPAVWYGYFLLV